MNTLAIVVAAGRGERMAGGRPKAFLPLAGQPILLRAVRSFQQAPSIDGIVAVVPGSEIAAARSLLAGLDKLRAVVGGGARRQDSVREGMKQAPAGFDGIVLVHDAARPLVEPALIEAVVVAARSHGAALPVLELADTIKRIDAGRVVGTVDRDGLAAAQTPQGFRYRLLAQAYELAFRDLVTLTDEAMAVERLGEPVATVEGVAQNRKLTTPEDLEWAETILGTGSHP